MYKLVYISFQFVAVAQTTTSVLINEIHVNALNDEKCNPDVCQDCAVGDCAFHHLLVYNQILLNIQFFNDGLGVANPLEGRVVVDNNSIFLTLLKICPGITIYAMPMFTY
jgi:hypothetical protein